MTENVEDLKAEVAKRDRTNRILKAEIVKLKKSMKEKSYESLSKKIDFLENELKKKEKELKDYKSVASSGNNTQELKTKIIILQSKIRKSNQDLEKLKNKCNNLELKNKRLEKQLEDKEESKELSDQIEQYRKRIARYKSTISDLSQTAEKANALEQEVLKLRKKLAQKPSRPTPSSNEFAEFAQGNDNATIQNLKTMIEERDQEIQRLENQLASGGGTGGFLSQNRTKRKIKELEAQI
ncbi:MAG: hypothetical protein GF364_20400, partial [Candidatus Lokiarchaeota archaeon]|nr:hypothetical protein [Candidatus Lokiarchaeota archaeon]